MSGANLIRPAIRAAAIKGDLLPTWLMNHTRKDRIIKAALSAPPWVDRKAIAKLYKRAAQLSELTEIKHVVDHIIPIDHPDVCGLTVPWNMQVITAKANAFKGAKWAPDQDDLFTEPEQLRIF